jgi:hypothetical protein
MKGGALAEGAGCPDPPTLELDEPPHDRQAEAAPTRLAGTGPIGAPEPIEDSLQIGRGDPWASIADRNRHHCWEVWLGRAGWEPFAQAPEPPTWPLCLARLRWLIWLAWYMGAEMHLPTRRGVAQGILDQVAKHLG